MTSPLLNFGSMASYGPLTGGLAGVSNTDYLAALEAANSVATPLPQQEGGFMSGIGKLLKESGFLGSTDANGIKTDGWGGMALGGLGALGKAFMGMQQYGLMKKQLAEGKRQFNLNYDAQKRTTNAALEDRQRARLASNSGAYESLGSYMNKNGIQ